MHLITCECQKFWDKTPDVYEWVDRAKYEYGMEVTTVKGTPPIIHIYEHQIVGCFDHNQIDQSGKHLVDDSTVPQKKVKYEMN